MICPRCKETTGEYGICIRCDMQQTVTRLPRVVWKPFGWSPPLVAAAALLLAACATTGKVAPGVEPAKPVGPDPIICASLEDEPKPDGGIVRPVGPAATAATERFMDAEIDTRQWGRRGWFRARVAQEQLCPPH